MSICYETFTDRDGLTRFCVSLSEHEGPCKAFDDAEDEKHV